MLIVRVFAELHCLAKRKNYEYWFFQVKLNYRLFAKLPSSLKNWKDQFFILRTRDPCGLESVPQSWNYLVERPQEKIILNQDEIVMIKKLKSQANSHRYSCSDVTATELKWWLMNVVT